MLEGFPFRVDTQEDLRKEDSNFQSEEIPRITSKSLQIHSNLITVGLLGSPPAVDSQEERGDKYLLDKSSKIKS